MTEDILARLKRDFEQQQAVLSAAKNAVEELRLAILAIEQSRRSVWGEASRRNNGNVVKRGALKGALLDCLLSGIGNRSAFSEALKTRGVETSESSISNALHRMMLRKEIGWDPRRNAYFTRNEIGPDTEVTGPLQLNGVASNGA